MQRRIIINATNETRSDGIAIVKLPTDIKSGKRWDQAKESERPSNGNSDRSEGLRGHGNREGSKG